LPSPSGGFCSEADLPIFGGDSRRESDRKIRSASPT
jgi:hypothetical protein